MLLSISRWMCAAFSVSFLVGSASFANSQTLRYAPKAENEYQYEFDIRFDLGVEETRLSGVTTYQIESSSDQAVRLNFSGGLRETKKPNNPVGIPARPRLPTWGPGFRSPYRGITSSSNSVTLSDRGETLVLKGESQLPYLLGHLSLLPFEPLPSEDQNRWSVEGSMNVLSEQAQDRWRPFDHLLDQNDRDLRAAKTKLSFQIIEQDDKQAVIQKDYEMMLSPSQDEATLELSGTGQWTFDKIAKMPLAMDFRYELTIQIKNVTVKAPLTLKYHRLTPEDIARRKVEKKEREAKAKLAAEKRQQESQRPVTAEEKTVWMTGLQSEKSFDQVRTLNELAGRSPQERDPSIVEAISKLIAHENRAVAMSAERALKKWDPAYQERVELDTKYSRSMPLDSTGRTVTSETSLYVGQVIQVQENNGWWKAAEVTELLGSGRVEVEMRDHWKERKIYDRVKIQLPPEAFVQPSPRPESVEPKTIATHPEPLTSVRTWKDASGKFTIEAKLLLVANGKLVLSRTDGKLVTVPLDKMSQADQSFIENLAAPAVEPVNPFEPQ